jgi:hypothetical protein
LRPLLANRMLLVHPATFITSARGIAIGLMVRRHTAVCVAGCRLGIEMRKVDPCPGVLRAVIVPPRRSTMRRQMTSPMPAPS